MASLKRLILWFLAAAIVLGGLWLLREEIQARKEKRDSPRLISAYKSSVEVSPLPKSALNSSEPKKWAYTVDIPGLPKILVEAHEGVGGKVIATYASDNSRWLVANPGDYVYPQEIRIDPATKRLYVFAGGFAGGIWRVARLYEFDLVSRHQLSKAEIEPALIQLQAKP